MNSIISLLRILNHIKSYYICFYLDSLPVKLRKVFRKILNLLTKKKLFVCLIQSYIIWTESVYNLYPENNGRTRV